MARIELLTTPMTPNGLTLTPAGVAGNADGHYVDTNTRTTFKSTPVLEELFLEVTVATATTNVTVRAGDSPPALDAVLGDEVCPVPVGTHKIGPFASGRFLKRDGRIHIDYATAANITAVRAYRIPRQL